MNLSDCPDFILELACALPLVPVSSMKDAFAIIYAEIELLKGTYSDLIHFKKYLKSEWSRKASVFSVYGCPQRTDNISESFNSKINEILGVHPNIWAFLGSFFFLLLN